MTANGEDKRISEALELLNEVAKEKRAELQGIVSEKYGSLKSLLGGLAEGMQATAQETLAQGKQKVQELASDVGASVRKNPWPYLGGTALGFLILGYFFGKSRK